MIPDAILKRVQDLFRPSPVLLVGSGFSCGYGLPGMGDIAQHLLREIDSHPLSAEAAHLWQSHRTEIERDFEKGLNQIASGAEARKELIDTVRVLIASLIIEKTTLAEAKILTAGNHSDEPPARLIRRLFDGIPQNSDCVSLITTNYDTLIELFCDLADLPVETGFYGLRHRRFRGTPIFQTRYSPEMVADRKGSRVEYRRCASVRLMKPHGSISWHETAQGAVEILNDVAPASRAIVIPGPTKYEDALVSTVFDAVRNEMNGSIQRATGLMCLGFGFNDIHLQGVIQARLDNRMPTLILTKNLTDSIRSLLFKYPHIIAICEDPGGSACHCEGGIHLSDAPLWQLDGFLKFFLE